ncbi:protein required for normal CLN1 and CLN2 G1 cyclin expression [Irineochytrium annulatum]|nr:protein required for normal CLN1 and CLN2 G1 cyclin expression [Irineochytrium annulatum]
MSGTTIQFNLARVLEDMGDFDRAEKLHRTILDTHPAYVESTLRLAHILLTRGKMAEARNMIQGAVEADRKNILASLLLGHYFVEDKSLGMNRFKEARRVFEELLQKVDKHEPYALVGNINLIFSKIDQKNRDTHARRAFEFFDKALKLDNKNVYAAAGIGIALAEVGRLPEAREVLSQVQESSSNMPFISISLAHVLVELMQPKLAITLVLKRVYENKSSYIWQCLARAYYIIAKSEKDPEAMLRSLQCIQRALRIEPGRFALHFDAALVKQQYAQVLNEQPIEKRSLAMLKKAVLGLEASRRMFSALGEAAVPSPGYDLKQAKERATYCKDVLRMSDKKIHETEVLEKQRQERLEMIKQEKIRADREKAEKERIAKEEEQRKKEETLLKRTEAKEKMRLANEAAIVAAKNEKERSAQKGADDFIANEDKSEDEDGEGKKRRSSGKTKKPPAKRKKIVNSSDEEGETKRKREKGKASQLSSEFIEDDDDE